MKRPIVELWPLARLKPYANNPRANDAAVPAVAASIREFGFLVPIVATPDGEILAGHTRLKAALSLGLGEAPVLVARDLDEAKARAFRLADNKTAELAEWDLKALDAELDGLGDLYMAQFGFEPKDEPAEGETEADDAPGVEVDEPPRSEPGARYALGEHVLICGDSTDARTAARLMGGNKAALLLTDPPYNLAYEGAAGTIANDSMTEGEFLTFLTRAFKAAAGVLAPGAAFYIFHADLEELNILLAAKAAELRVRQCLVWVKNHLVLGRKDYQVRHEPCLYGWAHDTALYGWKAGAPHRWFADRRQTTVLEFPKPAKSAEHPTMKPVALLEALLHNSSARGDLVLDPFGGSGSTLIACERMGRRARLAELEPRFCDVIRRRWAEHVHGAGCDWEALTPSLEEGA